MRDCASLWHTPTVASYGRAWAVCDMAAGPPGLEPRQHGDHAGDGQATRSGVYGVDMEKAYCFVPVQRADRHTGCYLWPDDDGRVRVHVSWRMVFGGSPWPNRFERLSLLSCAWVQRAQHEFDEEQPPQAEATAAWKHARAALQQAGALPAGPEQTRPAGIEPFLDDCSGRALWQITGQHNRATSAAAWPGRRIRVVGGPGLRRLRVP